MRTLSLVALATLLLCASAQAQLGPAGNLLLTDTAPDPDGQFSEAMAAGDFDGDGDTDLAIGAPRHGSGFDGRVLVFLNTAGSFAPGQHGGTFDGAAADQFGDALASCDFDGDGRDELAVGVPGDDGGGVEQNGAVLIYALVADAGPGGLRWVVSQELRQGDTLGGSPVEGARLGRALACADFNSDGFADLAIGAPEKAVAALDGAGEVVVAYGRTTGLDRNSSQRWSQNSEIGGVAVGGVAEAGDNFGFVLATGDFDGDGYPDLAIGAPHEDVNDAPDAGVVQVLRGSFDGITPVGQSFVDIDFLADTLGLGEFAEEEDRFGYTLAAGDFDRASSSTARIDDLAIGTPYKAAAGASRAGVVYVLNGASDEPFESGTLLSAGDTELAAQSESFGMALAAGDIDDDGRDDLAIGREGRDVNTYGGAGAVSVFYGRAGAGLEDARTQALYASDGYASAPPADGAGFGNTLLAADLDSDGDSDLAIGVRDQPVSGVDQAGAVQLVFAGPLFADGFE